MSKKGRKNLYIPSIDAKDIYIANHYIEPTKIKYSLHKKNGDINLHKFKNSFDYSLDLIELRNVAEDILPKRDKLSFVYKNKEYSDKIINITFKYAVKEFNRVGKDTYVRNGYNLETLKVVDGKCIIKDEDDLDILVVIQVNTKMINPIPATILPDYFGCHFDEDKKGYFYKEIKNIPTVVSSSKLRDDLYKNGFYCEGKKYIRYKRSSGAARVGKVLFIDERLYNSMHKSEQCGLDLKLDDKIDLAGFEAYIALPTSSIIDTLVIKPENILVIKDEDSVFKEIAVQTYEGEDHHLYTQEKEMTISNSIWDGQSLIERDLMGEYQEKGMVLLRNKFFKSCCFNTNIQKFFADNNITSIEQLNGTTIATDIKDIKLITTPKSIKFYKFGNLDTWLKNIYPVFGVVKYEKDTHFFDGKMVQAHYQLLNTLQLSEEQVYDLVKPGLDYISLLNTDVDVMRYHIGCIVNEEDKNNNVMKTKNDIVYNLLHYECGFENTKIYYDFKKDLCKSYVKNIKKGHVLIDGTYATLFGNPYEMLLHSIGKYSGKSDLGVGSIYNTRYPFGTEILCCRSPHVTIGNIMLTTNKDNSHIKEYFNLTDKIICINSINENVLERLSGADFDSDTCIITNNTILINAAKKYYDLFKVPTRDVNPPSIKHSYNPESLSRLDRITGTNKIGEIVNFSQELNSLLWDKVYKAGGDARACFDGIKDIYYDVCQLDVMSNIEIDKAKKEFSVSNSVELKKMKEKYANDLITEDNKKKMPNFLGYIARIKKYKNRDRKDYQKYNTTMDYLLHNINKSRSKKSNGREFVPLGEVFRVEYFDKGLVNYDQIDKIINGARETNKYLNYLYAKENMDGEEKRLLLSQTKENFVEQLNNLKINEHTMYRLLLMIDKDKCRDIQSLLFYSLFNYENNTLTNILADMKKNFVFLSKDNSGDIDIYGQKYKKSPTNGK